MANPHLTNIITGVILVFLFSAFSKEYNCICTRESTKEVYALNESKLYRRSTKKWYDSNGAENSLAYGTINCALQYGKGC